MTWNTNTPATLSNGNLTASLSCAVEELYCPMKPDHGKPANVPGKFYFQFHIHNFSAEFDESSDASKVFASVASDAFDSSQTFTARPVNASIAYLGDNLLRQTPPHELSETFDLAVEIVGDGTVKVWGRRTPSGWNNGGDPETGTNPEVTVTGWTGDVYGIAMVHMQHYPGGTSSQHSMSITGRFTDAEFTRAAPAGFAAWGNAHAATETVLTYKIRTDESVTISGDTLTVVRSA